MKKVVFISTMMLLTFSAFCQQSQPKVRYTQGFFNTRYEIGDNDADEKTVLAHFEKTHPAAYYDFKRGMALDVQSTVSGVIGSAGLLIGIFSKKSGARAVGYGLGAVGYTYSLVVTFGAKAKKESAINAYNKNFGY